MKLFDGRQEVKFIRMLLNNPYKYLGTTADPKLVSEKFGIYLNSDFDFEGVISKLQNAMKSRGRGIDRELMKQIQSAKYKWANDLLDDVGSQISTMGSLNTICRKVWGSRISDIYVSQLKDKINLNLQIKTKLESYQDDLFSRLEEAPTEEAPTEEEPPSQTCVSIGEVTISVPKGSVVSISKMELGDFKVIGGGSIKIGRVTKSNFEDIVIQG